MPGYILHLTAAKILLEKYDLPMNQNDFFIGNLLPDAVKDKSKSHFRSEERKGKMVEYPEVELFRKKYQDLMNDSSVLGYDFHLYIDRKFFIEYYPKILKYLNNAFCEELEMDKVEWTYICKIDKIVPVQQFLSEEYYYGDFTKMNSWLVETYRLPMKLNTNLQNPGIEEVDYKLVENVLQELKGYCNSPLDAVQELTVFDLKDLIIFLEKAADEWITDQIEKGIYKYVNKKCVDNSMKSY